MPGGVRKASLLPLLMQEPLVVLLCCVSCPHSFIQAGTSVKQ